MKKILLIQTGGTIAMNMQEGKVRLDLDQWSQLLDRQFPELAQLADIDTLPLFFEDSSDLNPSHWLQLASQIEKNYTDYDGFVILHGTDTMAYTASALSFGLRGIQKPVIFTGSQVPMSNIRSDARRNLVNSIELATYPIREVAICFNDKLYRANRTTKMSIGDFDAFSSPNIPPLAEIGLNIRLGDHLLSSSKPFENTCSYNRDVFVLTVYPGMNIDFLECLDLSSLKGLVVRAFGSGNFPVKGAAGLLPFFEKCINHDVILAIVSQADYDAVDLGKYEAGRLAEQAGALSGSDMTLEAALTKLMYLLATNTSKTDIKRKFTQNLAGEVRC